MKKNQLNPEIAKRFVCARLKISTKERDTRQFGYNDLIQIFSRPIFKFCLSQIVRELDN